MARVELHARRRMHSLPAHGLEELQRLGDRVDDFLIRIAQRRVTQEPQVPVLGMMQVGEPAVDERAHEIERERGALVAAQQQLRIGLALRHCETRPIDVVAPVRRQRHSAAGLGVRRARLRILTGEPADPDDGLFQALQQHQAHLQKNLQALRDIVRFAVLEALRTVAALQQELHRRTGPAPSSPAMPRPPRTPPAAAAGSTRRPPARAPRDRRTWAAGWRAEPASSQGANWSGRAIWTSPRCYTAGVERRKSAPGGASRAGAAECRPRNAEALVCRKPMKRSRPWGSPSSIPEPGRAAAAGAPPSRPSDRIGQSDDRTNARAGARRPPRRTTSG